MQETIWYLGLVEILAVCALCEYQWSSFTAVCTYSAGLLHQAGQGIAEKIWKTYWASHPPYSWTARDGL